MKSITTWSAFTGSASIISLTLAVLSIIGFMPTLSITVLSITGDVVLFSINPFFIFMPIFVVSTVLAFYFLSKL